MEETQNYLNSILEKRAGSVSNPYASKSRLASKAATNKPQDGLTRIPIVQEKVEDTPTLFKKKMQTVYYGGSGSIAQAHSNPSIGRYGMQGPTGSIFINQKSGYRGDQSPNKSSSQQKQRVEYMLITKRIQQRQEQEQQPTAIHSNHYVPESTRPRIPLPGQSLKNRNVAIFDNVAGVQTQKPIMLLEKPAEAIPQYNYRYQSTHNLNSLNGSNILVLQDELASQQRESFGGYSPNNNIPVSGQLQFPQSMSIIEQSKSLKSGDAASSQHTPINDLMSQSYRNSRILLQEINQSLYADSKTKDIYNSQKVPRLSQQQPLSHSHLRSTPDTKIELQQTPEAQFNSISKHPRPQIIVQRVDIEPVPPAEETPIEQKRRRKKIFQKNNV